MSCRRAVSLRLTCNLIGRVFESIMTCGQFVDRCRRVPGINVEAGLSGQDAIDREQELAKTLLDRSLYHQAFTRLDEVRMPSGVRVLVLIDDLDRCHPDKAIWLLESIKLVLGQPGFVFVLGVARRVIESSWPTGTPKSSASRTLQVSSISTRSSSFPFTNRSPTLAKRIE